MDLNDQTEHKVFREEVRTFLDGNKHLAPGESAFSFRMRPRNLAEDVRRWQGLLVDHGLTSRTIPKAYGGYGPITAGPISGLSRLPVVRHNKLKNTGS